MMDTMIKESHSLYLKLQEAAREVQKREMDILEKDAIMSHTFSEKFNIKMDKLMKSSKKPYYKFINTLGKRAAVIIITLFTALSVTTFSVKAIREPVIQFVISIFEKFTNVRFNDENSKLQLKSIEEFYQPEYLPKGYSLKDNNNYGNIIEIVYSDGKDDLFFEQYTADSVQFGLDTEGTAIETFTLEGKEIIFYNNKGIHCIIWSDGKYSYKINGVISKDEMLKMVKLVKQK